MALSKEALWNSGRDESVEVNQRALIDKVLARYSGEFTVFRELLQNSDDAASKCVEIHFETRSYLDRKGKAKETWDDSRVPNLKTDLVTQWTFKNDGIVFREDDWRRLKKIAEGNPDEEKIGAFGVGFYSLFSVTEEPFVTSGGQWMGFYWKDKKDQLFARRGNLPESANLAKKLWTTFEMLLREPAPMPIAFDLARFLASSITFMVHLRDVSVFIDGCKLVRLVKEASSPTGLIMPRGLKPSSPQNMMIVKGISKMPISIEAEVAHCVYSSGYTKPQLLAQTVSALKPAIAATSVTAGFFSSLFSSFASSTTPAAVDAPSPCPAPVEKDLDPMEVNKTSVLLHVFSAAVDTRLDKKMIAELERSTKKKPPSQLRLDLIYTGKGEYDASKQEDEKMNQPSGSIFQGLRADLTGTGSSRIFIGHATGQTTGLGGHIAARFIPTVERESIDLVDRTVSMWNKELLYVGGYLARAAYEAEMENVRDLWEATVEGSQDIHDQTRRWLTQRCLHALKFFTFRQSTPSAVVSSVLEGAFFSSSISGHFPVVSSVGVRNAAVVRIPDPTFSAFLMELPVLPDELASGAQTMIDALRARGLVKETTFADVLNELRSRPLTAPELVACMKWWISVWNAGKNIHANLPQIQRQFLEATVLTTGSATSGEKIIPLDRIRTFFNVHTSLPQDGPCPDHTMPLEITRSFSDSDLKAAFGWDELSVVDWTKCIADPAYASLNPEYDLAASAVWSERVLNTLARAWPSLSKSNQSEIAEILKDKACIPTRAGLKSPKEAYFPNAHIFSDLAVITMPTGSPVKGQLERVLEALGARKHVDLQIVFDRMIKTGDWSISDLIKYLVTVVKDLTILEVERLRQTAAFPKESATGSTENNSGRTRFKASELYEPFDILRELKLPILDWGSESRWKPNSEEAKFLYSLNLRRFPPLFDLLQIAAKEDQALRSAALKYFFTNHSKYYADYDPSSFYSIAYVPAISSDGKKVLATPDKVFTVPEISIFGFLVVDPSLNYGEVDKLKLKRQPSTELILSVLANSAPRDRTIAQKWFEVLTGRITDLTTAQTQRIGDMAIVPVLLPSNPDKPSAPLEVRMLKPKDCYFKRDSSQTLHSKLFVFIDFGTKGNAFLGACGTKHEPSVEEICQILLLDPRQFWELSDGKENYLAELRNIAVNWRLVSKTIAARMKRSSFLLGTRRVKSLGASKNDAMEELEDDQWELQYDLLRPDQIAIVDDTNAYQIFGDTVFSAPQEDILEEFYSELGSPRLSRLIKNDYGTPVEIKDARLSKDLRSLVLERLPLFLHEHTHARPKVQYSWLKNEGNFVVRTFGKLAVMKHLAFGSIRKTSQQDLSATARRALSGPIEIWVANNAQVDMYEVAISLCRILFDVPKANDALLLMTILSTDLRSLRRRGYNVDRILKKQREEREAAEQMKRDKEKVTEKLVSDVTRTTAAAEQPIPAATDKTNAMSKSSRAASPSPEAATIGTNAVGTSNSQPVSAISSQWQQWRRKMGSLGPFDQRSHSPVLGAVSGTGGQGRQSTSSVTPMSDIEQNIRRAINACKEEGAHVLRDREHMHIVKESMEDGYCDVSGRIGDLQHIGFMADVKLFVSKEISNGSTIVETKGDSIARFIHVIRPLRELYKLPPTCIHIFLDVQGETIAFNRNASIFLNLRYFEAWHDRDVQDGQLTKAWISWFFTLAHEIAHNLVQLHNSEHEFYFSSICEAHVPQLARLLTSSNS